MVGSFFIGGHRLQRFIPFSVIDLIPIYPSEWTVIIFGLGKTIFPRRNAKHDQTFTLLKCDTVWQSGSEWEWHRMWLSQTTPGRQRVSECSSLIYKYFLMANMPKGRASLQKEVHFLITFTNQQEGCIPSPSLHTNTRQSLLSS